MRKDLDLFGTAGKHFGTHGNLHQRDGLPWTCDRTGLRALSTTKTAEQVFKQISGGELAGQEENLL